MPTAAVLGAMLVLNILAPLMADDFCYAASSLTEVWTKAVNEYFTWNGRFPAHFFGPLFSIAPWWVFDFANTLVFGLLLFGMTVLARGSRLRRIDFRWPPVLAFFFLWFGVADFGQSMLWQMGSANYLWTTTIVVIFLIPYRFLVDDIDVFERRKGLSFAFSTFAVVSGWSNENTAATAWLLAGLAVLIHRRKVGRTPTWAAVGLMAHAVGLLAMVMSPGHHVRLASPVFQAWSDLPWLTRVIRFAPNAIASITASWVIWGAVLGGAAILYRHRSELRRRDLLESVAAAAFVCAAVLNNLVLVLAPMAPQRALTGGAVYLTVAAMILAMTSVRFLARRPAALIAIGGASVLAFSIIGSVAEYSALNFKVKERQAAIALAQEAGTTSLKLDPIVVSRSRHMYWGSITDITYQPTHWANTCFGSYIGADSVRLVTPLEDGSSIRLGPESPIALDDGVIIDEVLFSPEHACVSVALRLQTPEAVEGSFLDVRVLSDASPWHRKAMDRVRRKFFPATTEASFEYPHSRLRKIAVFGSFTIHSIFLDDQAMVDEGDGVVVFVPLTENAGTIRSLVIGRRRAHDATMRMHRLH